MIASISLIRSLRNLISRNVFSLALASLIMVRDFSRFFASVLIRAFLASNSSHVLHLDETASYFSSNSSKKCSSWGFVFTCNYSSSTYFKLPNIVFILSIYKVIGMLVIIILWRSKQKNRIQKKSKFLCPKCSKVLWMPSLSLWIY